VLKQVDERNELKEKQPVRSLVEDIEQINLLNASAASISFDNIDDKKGVHRAEMHLDDSI
jgi:hypothetical protein